MPTIVPSYYETGCYARALIENLCVLSAQSRPGLLELEGPETHQLESQDVRSFSSTIQNDVIIAVLVGNVFALCKVSELAVVGGRRQTKFVLFHLCCLVVVQYLYHR
jgi:hypothetical protein